MASHSEPSLNPTASPINHRAALLALFLLTSQLTSFCNCQQYDRLKDKNVLFRPSGTGRASTASLGGQSDKLSALLRQAILNSSPANSELGGQQRSIAEFSHQADKRQVPLLEGRQQQARRLLISAGKSEESQSRLRRLLDNMDLPIIVIESSNGSPAGFLTTGEVARMAHEEKERRQFSARAIHDVAADDDDDENLDNNQHSMNDLQKKWTAKSQVRCMFNIITCTQNI